MTKAEHIQDVLRFFASKGRKVQRGKGESPRPLSRPAPFHKGALARAAKGRPYGVYRS